MKEQITQKEALNQQLLEVVSNLLPGGATLSLESPGPAGHYPVRER